MGLLVYLTLLENMAVSLFEKAVGTVIIVGASFFFKKNT
jgi:hypothetical protein